MYPDQLISLVSVFERGGGQDNCGREGGSGGGGGRGGGGRGRSKREGVAILVFNADKHFGGMTRISARISASLLLLYICLSCIFKGTGYN